MSGGVNVRMVGVWVSPQLHVGSRWGAFCTMDGMWVAGVEVMCG